MERPPLVSIVMPIRNEERHLQRALEAIDLQTYPPDRIEIIVVDGGSTDGTLELVSNRMAADPRVRLLGGDGVNTPLAMELGRAQASGEIIAKVDGHGWINEGFIRSAVEILEADPGIGCVGGRIHPVAATEVERGIALARFSRFGVGGGIYTADDRAQDTDTVQCGVYRREALAGAGGFDPDLPFGEDEEANFRLRQQGWRIRLEPAMRFHYRVRPTIGDLFRQYSRYGRARVAVIRKHPSFFRVKHVIPGALVGGLLGALPLAVLPGWRVMTGTIWIGYTGAVLLAGAYLSVRSGYRRPDVITRGLVALHLGYGLGTWRGLLDVAKRTHGVSAARGERDRVPDGAQPEKQDR